MDWLISSLFTGFCQFNLILQHEILRYPGRRAVARLSDPARRTLISGGWSQASSRCLHGRVTPHSSGEWCLKQQNRTAGVLECVFVTHRVKDGGPMQCLMGKTQCSPVSLGQFWISRFMSGANAGAGLLFFEVQSKSVEVVEGHVACLTYSGSQIWSHAVTNLLFIFAFSLTISLP